MLPVKGIVCKNVGGGGQGPELVKELRRDLTLDRLVSVHCFLSRARIFVIDILRSREPANFQSPKLANRNGCTIKDNCELNGYCEQSTLFRYHATGGRRYRATKNGWCKCPNVASAAKDRRYLNGWEGEPAP